MELSRIDLNLFTVFDAIYREGGITSASRRLHLSQPAVSHALSRLRELLNDPLFERQGNEMVPTPMARSLAATIGSSLGSLEQMLQSAGRFDPATSARSFTIAVRDANEPGFLPSLAARLRVAAPRVDVAAVRIDRGRLEADLESGLLDVALDVALPLSPSVRREHVSSEPLAVLASKEHPLIRGALDIDTYLAAEHVLVTGRRRGSGYEDLALGRLGMSRRIRLRCQYHAAASEIVSQTDLLATMSRSQAHAANLRTHNQVLPLPAQIPPIEMFLYWHANVEEDSASQWFRAMLLRAIRRSPEPE